MLSSRIDSFFPGVAFAGITFAGVTLAGVTIAGVTIPGVTFPGVTFPGVTLLIDATRVDFLRSRGEVETESLLDVIDSFMTSELRVTFAGEGEVVGASENTATNLFPVDLLVVTMMLKKIMAEISRK